MNSFPEKVLLATDGLENTTLAAVDLAMKGDAELHVDRLRSGGDRG